MRPRLVLPKFVSNHFYKVKYDDSIIDSKGNSAIYLHPDQNARELISQYYSDKYSATIYFPIESQTSNLVLHSSISSFAKNIKYHLAMAKEKYGNGDCRIAFFLGTDGPHATPVIYMKENGHEGILYADSKGADSHKANLMAQSGIPVYAVLDKRQRDGYSCYLDAILFGRDATAKNPKTNDYTIQNLLLLLKSNAEKKEMFYTITLPSELVKTSQLSSFTKFHHGKNPTDKIIHIHKNKPETLKQFRDRYTQKNVKLIPTLYEISWGAKEITGANIPSYLRDKSIKLADIIEIQFYANLMKKILGDKFTDRMLSNFIKTAKGILQAQGRAIPRQEREGLHAFAIEYASVFKSRINFSTTSTVSFLFEPTRKYGINRLCIHVLLDGIQKNSADIPAIHVAKKLIAQLKGASHTKDISVKFNEEDYSVLNSGWLKEIVDRFPAAALLSTAAESPQNLTLKNPIK